MKIQEIAILLPCHSLEDFPSDGDGAMADGLFAGWTSLWHPLLLAAAGRKPTWYRADNPPSDFPERLYIVPPASESRLHTGWIERARAGGAAVIADQTSRSEIIREALSFLDEAPALDAEIVADFFALGFAYLIVELLTRHMRYTSSLDQIHLENKSVAAARAALAGDLETMRAALERCFESLQGARERFYAVDSYLIDLTLVAETTLRDGLRAELERGYPSNYMITGKLVEQLFAAAPENGELLKQALTRGKSSIVGGEWREEELPLAPMNELLENFTRGMACYQEKLGKSPAVFGRRRAGLSPALPQVLSRFGFRGALHVTLDEGLFPNSTQSRIRWEGTDQSVIDCLARVPLDASRPESFLGLCRAIGESMDRDHVATVAFAHWPGQGCTWYEDLRRVTRHGDCLGKFVTLEDYFTETHGSGRLMKFDAEKYRVPYLHQAVTRKDPQPISASIERHEREAASYRLNTLRAMNQMLGGAKHDDASIAASALAERLAVGGNDTRSGVFVFNPHSATRTAVVEWPAAWGACEGDVPQQLRHDKLCTLVTVPAIGYAWLALNPGQAAASTKSAPLVNENTLQNEYLDVTIGTDTGALRSLRDLRIRGTLLSQQLARRWPGERPRPGDTWRDPDETAIYSVMAADEITVLANGPVFGAIRARGRLMHPEGNVAARFEQTYRLDRGSRVLQIEIQLEPLDLPSGNPWECYFASRLAWADAAADVRRSTLGGAVSTEAKQVEAAQYIEMETPKSQCVLFANGAPYHRRSAMRMLDTILIPPGESCRHFKLHIGPQLPYPAQEAWAQAAPLVVADRPVKCPAAGPKSWLFHVDAKNLLATNWSVIERDGRVSGVKVRLLETAGRGGQATLRALRNLTAARQVNYLGETLTELPTAADACTIDFSGNEWLELETEW